MTSESQISYLRIAGSAVAWFCIAERPLEFGAVWVMSDLLSWFSTACLSGKGKTPMTDKMLRNVADILWASILMFSRVIVCGLAPI